jgi:hypothetical protein
VGRQPARQRQRHSVVHSVRFEWGVCRLRLNSTAEAQAAGLNRWEVENADPHKYEEPADLDEFYDRYGDRY